MKRAISRVASISTAAVALLISATGRASDTFPGEIKKHLDMDCAPSCTLCHVTPAGGGTPDKLFAAYMIRPGGLERDKPETVAPALDTVEAMAIDTDMDGTGDVKELEDGRNPNVALTSQQSDELICPPEYGCGARVSPRPPVDGSALAFALGVAGYLGLRLRRRARPLQLPPTPPLAPPAPALAGVPPAPAVAPSPPAPAFGAPPP